MEYKRYNCKYCNKEVDINKEDIGISQNNGCWHSECKNNKYKITRKVLKQFLADYVSGYGNTNLSLMYNFDSWLQDKLNNN